MIDAVWSKSTHDRVAFSSPKFRLGSDGRVSRYFPGDHRMISGPSSVVVASIFCPDSDPRFPSGAVGTERTNNGPGGRYAVLKWRGKFLAVENE